MARTFVSSSSEYLKSTAGLVSGQDLTLAAWFRLDDSGVNGTVFSVCRDTGGAIASQELLCIATTGGFFRCRSSKTTLSATATTTSTVGVGEWHHIAANFISDTSREIYMDGANKVTNTTSVGVSGLTSTLIGSRILGVGTEFFVSGGIAHCAGWSPVLTEEQIGWLAAGMHPLHMRPLDIKGYWPVDGFKSPEPDVSQSGTTFDMTVNGTPLRSVDDPPVEPFHRSRGMFFVPAAVATISDYRYRMRAFA